MAMEAATAAPRSSPYIDRLGNVIEKLREYKTHMQGFVDRIEGNPSQLKDAVPAVIPNNIPGLINELEELAETFAKSGTYLAQRF